MVSTEALVCGFVPMRGSDEQPEDVVRLAEEAVLAVDATDGPEATALADALRHPPLRHWTGVGVRHDEPAEHLDLWLAYADRACGSFGRLSVGPSARESGVDPTMRWAGATFYDRGTVAYLAARSRDDDTIELGIVAHGPDSRGLVAVLDDLLQRWGEERPAQPTMTATPATSAVRSPGRVMVVRKHTRLTVTW